MVEVQVKVKVKVEVEVKWTWESGHKSKTPRDVAFRCDEICSAL